MKIDYIVFNNGGIVQVHPIRFTLLFSKYTAYQPVHLKWLL